MPASRLLSGSLHCTCVRAQLLVLLLLLSGVGIAQIGLHPPTVDYQQLVTPNARILFPKGYEARANRVANMVDALRANHSRSIGDRHYNFDLVLQTPNTELNGYVGLAPFLSEFYVTPPQQLNLLSGTDWVDLLTIHEFRHVAQNSNERRGITKLFSFLQGQYGWAVFSGIATPDWFSEGDAVVYETALSKSGRGRTPAFSNTLRSLLAADVIYPYAKARNGSYRSLVPDHYRYGYALLTYARERFGNDVWRSVLHDGASYKGLIYPFSRALKQKTGYSTPALYQASMADLAARQDSALAARPALFEGLPFGATTKGIFNYRFPMLDDQGRVLALRSGFDVTPALVAVSAAGEKDEVITSVGIQREPYVEVRGDFAVWMEDRQDPRYTNLQYSDIILYELKSGRRRQLTQHGKFFAPSLSFDRRKIVAVQHDPLIGPPQLVVLETNTGAVAQTITRQAQALSFPRFAPDGNTLYFYERDYQGTALVALDLSNGKEQILLPSTTEPIDYLQVTADNQLVFTNGRDGINNVYLIDPATGTQRQLTNVGIGAQLPYLTPEGVLYYTEATPRGQWLRQLDLRTMKSQLGQLPGLAGGLLPAGPSVFERPAAFAAEAYDLTSQVPEKEYPTADFNDKLGGIKLHSWSYNGSYLLPGVTVEARNALNTVQITAGAEYNVNEGRTTTGLEVNYGGLYPVLGLSVTNRDRAYFTFSPRTDTVIFNRKEFNQLRAGVTAAVPLNWVNGDYFTSLRPAFSYAWNQLSDRNAEDLPGSFSDLGLRLSGGVLRRTAYRHVQSRLGGSFSLAYDRGFGENSGSRFLLRSSLYLPGLSLNHGLRLDADFQSESVNQAFQYPDVFLYPRGYGSVSNDQISRLGVNYHLPLLYPDFGLAGITYFKRIRLNAFYDFSQRRVNQFNFSQNLSSVGGQLFFDNRWLNVQDLTVGVETAYLLDADKIGIDNALQFRVLVSGGF